MGFGVDDYDFDNDEKFNVFINIIIDWFKRNNSNGNMILCPVVLLLSAFLQHIRKLRPANYPG